MDKYSIELKKIDSFLRDIQNKIDEFIVKEQSHIVGDYMEKFTAIFNLLQHIHITHKNLHNALNSIRSKNEIINSLKNKQGRKENNGSKI